MLWNHGPSAAARARGCASCGPRLRALTRIAPLPAWLGRAALGQRRAGRRACRRAAASPRGSRSACRRRRRLSPARTPQASPPPASQALTSVPIYSSLRLALAPQACSSCRTRPGILKAPQIQLRARAALLHLDFQHAARRRRSPPRRRAPGARPGRAGTTSRSSGSVAERVLGKPDRVGQADQHRLVRSDRAAARGRSRRTARPARAARRRRCRRRRSRRRNTAGCRDLPGEMTKQILSAPARIIRSTRYSLTARGRSTPLVEAAADRQQLLRERQRLDARAVAGGRDDAPHRTVLRADATARLSRRRDHAPLRAAPPCARSSVRSRAAARRSRASSASRERRAPPITSSVVVPATRISLPGAKKSSSPSHQSLRIGAPQAAASNRRPDGHQPIRAIAAA